MKISSDLWQQTWNSGREEVHNQGSQELSCITAGEKIHAVAVFSKRFTASVNLFSLLKVDQFVLRHLIYTRNLGIFPVRR